MSNNMPGNPYAERSGVSDSACENDGHWGIAQAVMALAYEQRTANLIAYLDYVTRMGMTGDVLTGPYSAVIARLSQDQEATP